MKKNPYSLFGWMMALLPGMLVLSGFLGAPGEKGVAWPEAGNQAKPWTRWWWPGNAVDRENISRELKEMARAGIGGVEITSIYGVKGEENKFIEYLSPEYSDMLNFTFREARKWGMGVDLPPGSGWRCGGPFVPEEKGLWSLQLHKFLLQKGQEFKPPAELTNVVLASFVEEDEEVTVIDLTGTFHAPARGTLYVAERIKKGDKVKRASDGGKGWAIDTFDEEITNWYLHEFWNRLGIDENQVRCFFHDSFEYTGDFTPHFAEEFNKRRGYNLAECLHVLYGDSPDQELFFRMRSDYRQTLGELVRESFIRPMTQWANSHQSMNRNQGHGSPGNVLDIYASCDIPETETFGRIEPGTVKIFVNKFASSAAHITGQKLVSSESFTWLDEHWQVTPAEMMRATNRLFLSGVNHMFFHGTCYSPADAPWPGWLFYASSQINNRNPLWPAFPALFDYIKKSQSILQQATTENDLLVYWPYFDVIAKEGNRLFFSLNIDKGDSSSWFNNYPLAGLSRRLTEAGYTFDYISDRQLLNCRVAAGDIVSEGGASYRAVVVPQTAFMPLETMRQLNDFIHAGGKVYFEELLPESVPGRFDYKSRQQQLNAIKQNPSLQKAAGNTVELLRNAGIRGESSLSEQGFHYIRMKLDDEQWYMIFNGGTKPLDEWVELNVPAQSYLMYYPDKEDVLLAESSRSSVRIQLEPERVVFIRCAKKKFKIPLYSYIPAEADPQELEGLWKINFIKGGPVYPGDITTRKLSSWTTMGDAGTGQFAGTARYALEFYWDRQTEKALLDLGEVKDCARIKLNGKEAGTLLGPSFRMVVDNLKRGNNLLEVEVTNVAANRIRYLDRQGVNWKRFYDINFVDIDYQPFNASGWEVKEAGLLGKVKITELPLSP